MTPESYQFKKIDGFSVFFFYYSDKIPWPLQLIEENLLFWAYSFRGLEFIVVKRWTITAGSNGAYTFFLKKLNA